MASGITKRPNGAWRARYLDNNGKERSKHFKLKRDAERFQAEVTAALVTGTYASPVAGKVTFAAYYQEWSARQVWQWNTRKNMDLAVGSTTFRDVPLARLRRSHVEQWVKAMVGSGLAASTIKTRVNNVRSVLRAAVRDRALARDPSEGVVLPRLRRREAAMELPTVEQMAALLAASDDAFRPFVAVAAFAGLRLGEACGLQVGDVDFLRRTISVRRQVQRVTGGLEVRAPKYESERTVSAPDLLLEMLAQHIVASGPGGGERARHLFLRPDGRLYEQNSVDHLWRRTCRSAHVVGVTLHDCRHYFASGLIAAGCDVVTVQRALGHSSPTITLNTYSHLWPTAEDRTRRAADALMAEALATPPDRNRTAGDHQGL